MKLSYELINKNIKFRSDRVIIPLSVWRKIAKALDMTKSPAHNHWAEIRGDFVCRLCGEVFDLPVEPVLK